MHRAFRNDPLTYESDPTTHTCKLLNWSNVVGYQLVKDFDSKKPSGKWSQEAQGKGQKREADGDWSNFGWPKNNYKGKGPGKNPEAQAMGAMQHPMSHTIPKPHGPGTMTLMATGGAILAHPAAGIPSKTKVEKAKARAPTRRASKRTRRAMTG